MMKKVRGLGRGFFILSALLLMFAVVGCDDSDSTEQISRADADAVNSGSEIFRSTFNQNSGVAQPYATNAAGATQEGGVDIDTVGSATVPANTTVYSDAARTNALPAGSSLVIKAFDQTSDDQLPDMSIDDDTEWQSAGFLEVYFEDDDGDRIDAVYFDNPVTMQITFADDAILPGGSRTIQNGDLVPVYQREGNGDWVQLDADPAVAGTQNFLVQNMSVTFTTDRFSHFSAQAAIPKAGIRVANATIDDNCDATITMGIEGNRTITGLVYVVFDLDGDVVDAGSSATPSFDLDNLFGEFDYYVFVTVEWTAGGQSHWKQLLLDVTADCQTGSGGFDL